MPLWARDICVAGNCEVDLFRRPVCGTGLAEPAALRTRDDERGEILRVNSEPTSLKNSESSEGVMRFLSGIAAADRGLGTGALPS
jgi:hypothetical protein